MIHRLFEPLLGRQVTVQEDDEEIVSYTFPEEVKQKKAFNSHLKKLLKKTNAISTPLNRDQYFKDLDIKYLKFEFGSFIAESNTKWFLK